MSQTNKVYLITSNAEAGTLETLPPTDHLEMISNDQLTKSDQVFGVHDKVCITSETSIEIISKRIDSNRKKAIRILKDKFEFRKILSKIYPNFQFNQVKTSDIPNLKINKKSVLNP
jgi:hypothetical protein